VTSRLGQHSIQEDTVVAAAAQAIRKKTLQKANVICFCCNSTKSKAQAIQ